MGTGTVRLAAGYARNKQDSFYELSTYDAIGNQAYAEASYRLPLGAAKLTIGANWRFEDLSSTGVNSLGAINNGLDDYRYSVPGIFAQLYTTAADNALEFNLSGRLDFHNVFGTIFSPRANMLWHHTDSLSSRFAIGRGFRAPTSFFEQDHGILDTEYVLRLIEKPERSTNASYALNYSRDGWAATASYNYNRITNLAILDPSQIDADGRPFTLFTSATTPVTIQGIDFNGSVRAAPGLTLAVGAEKYWFDFETGLLPFARPDLRLFFSTDYDPIPDLHLFTRLVWTGKQDLEKFHGTDRFNLDGSPKPLTAPSFVSWDARIEYFFLPDKAAAYVGVDNITNYNQAKRDGFLWLDSAGGIDVTHIWGPNRGRFVYAGIRLSY